VSETVDIEKGAVAAGGFASLDPSELTDLTAPAPEALRPSEAPVAESAAVEASDPSGAAPAASKDEAAPVEAPAVVAVKVVEAPARRFRPGGRMLAGACALLLLAGGATWAVLRHVTLGPAWVEQPAPSAPEPAAADAAIETRSVPVAVERIEWEGVFREIDAFRRLLFDKRDEIVRLQRHYDFGVRELEEEAVRLIKETGSGTLAAALKHPPLELLLQGIQRRQAYRDALAQPLQRLEQGSEELLFLERRARLDLQVREVAQGLDLQAQHQTIRSALAIHEPTAERLSIRGAGGAPAQESVWRRLSDQARQTSYSAEDRLNQAVVADACAGNLSRLAELTALSLKGAGCLAESGARELFLNRLTQLPPLAAQKLAEWPGRWLCLNGLKRLPAETAGELFGWPGEWLSLNGLSELSPDAGRHLAGWRGRQLELMGLRRLTAVDALAEWEASGGKLFVSGEIRQAIDALRLAGNAPGRSPAGQAR
jgi:hypothetical protein